ncbi:MAG: 16S rRNA (guanine(966)-N(2))-methyltransferase RsmD [Ruminococcaceae bacterium]|nr:16S rRNA (guanine(966)-N(2))-methyltransferase RsmD [Oscillospiraceae bacterium]
MMRIITGSAKGARLETLEGETTRPTAERTKEAVFSILQFDLEGRRVLDLFGGSGQLALEALSRGAASAYIADADPAACEVIKRNARKTKLFDRMTLLCTDFKSVLRNLSGKQTFHLVFLDPPYQSGYLPTALKLLSDYGLVTEGGYVVCETESPEPLSCPGMSLFRHSKYGRAYITILEKERTLS